MTKYLIVNADDYGRTAFISAGIRYAHSHGIVTTTTAMMNFPAAVEELRRAQAECPRLGLGVHLTLTAGSPVSPAAQAPTLVDSNGAFFKLDRLQAGWPSLNPAELRAEWQAQIEKFLATGATLDHLDSHHHVSYLSETALSVMLDLARQYNVPIRSPYPVQTPALPSAPASFVARLIYEKQARCPRFCITGFYAGGVTLTNLLGILSALPDGVSELMCHPGYVDETLLRDSSYNRPREEEINLLTGAEVKETIRAYQIKLCTFREVL